MPTVTVHLETPLARTFRVEQLAGLFDVPLAERVTHSLTAEVPGLDEPWTVGAIVGPSGSGKTSLARAAFGAIHEPSPWPDDLPLIECLDRGAGLWPALDKFGRPEAHPTIKDLARLLTAVGLGSARTWLKPYRVLSTGERFRADVARAVLDAQSRDGHRCEAVVESRSEAAAQVNRYSVPGTQYSVQSTNSASPLVIDEFTSTLDRTIAKTASGALSRMLRRGGSPRLAVLTCHDDILPWLAPDWILDLGSNQPRLTHCQPSPIEIPLRIERVPQAVWREFSGQHYLAGGLAASATCYAAFLDEEAIGSGRGNGIDTIVHSPISITQSPILAAPAPVAFCAVVAALGWKRTKRITRLVVRPEFQGLGLGTRLAESVAAIESAKGHRVTITASHPAIVGHCSHSPRWRYLGLKKTGSTPQHYAGRQIRCSTGRAVASFEFVA